MDYFFFFKNNRLKWPVADLGGDASFQGFDPLPTHTVSPLFYFEVFIFGCWMTDLKIFLKASSAPIYTNFNKGARAEKTRLLLSRFSIKFIKTPFWPIF